MTLLLCSACGADAPKQETEENVNNEAQETVVENAQGAEQIAEEKTTENADSEDNPNADGEVETMAAVYPMTITDQAGREVVIDKKPERLVSSYYITTSVLLALDLKNEIKGIESNPERRSIYARSAPQVLEVTQVGSPKEFDLEACASTAPDLVILPVRAKDMVEPLEKLEIPVIVVNPEGLDDILEMITLIGKVTDRQDRATKLTDYMQDKIAFLQENLEGTEIPSVYLGGNSSFFSTASKGMYQNDLISLAGGKNVAGEIDDTYWVEVSYEQILEWNPEYIVLASDAGYAQEDIKNDSNLAYCQAIEDEKIVQIPSDIEAWDSPVPGSFLGAVFVASKLHPEKITSKQYDEMVVDFYETFYGFTYEKQ